MELQVGGNIAKTYRKTKKIATILKMESEKTEKKSSISEPDSI